MNTEFFKKNRRLIVIGLIVLFVLASAATLLVREFCADEPEQCTSGLMGFLAGDSYKLGIYEESQTHPCPPCRGTELAALTLISVDTDDVAGNDDNGGSDDGDGGSDDGNGGSDDGDGGSDDGDGGSDDGGSDDDDTDTIKKCPKNKIPVQNKAGKWTCGNPPQDHDNGQDKEKDKDNDNTDNKKDKKDKKDDTKVVGGSDDDQGKDKDKDKDKKDVVIVDASSDTPADDKGNNKNK